MSQLILTGTEDYKPTYRAQIVQSLAEFRRDWQTLAKGESLFSMQASVGLILSDIADRLELNPQERHAMLGGKLINHVNCILEEKVGVELEKTN